MLQLEHVSKKFGATRAVEDVSLSIGKGEIVGIIGENGAGKTTLMRMVAGEISPDGGTIALDGRPGFVHQHFLLVNDFTIAENLALATGAPRSRIRSKAALELEAQRTIEETGISLPDPARRAGDLSVGEQSKLELIKAIAGRPPLLILDEPTSVLTPNESAELFAVLRRLADEGTAIAFISHKLQEVLDVVDRIAVMRRGRIVLETRADAMTPRQLASAMIATSPAGEEHVHQPREPHGGVVVSATDLRGERLNGASFSISRGEILAIVGVAGNGQAELAATVRGLTRPRGGRLEIAASRIAFIPEDRSREGIVGAMTIAENIALAADSWNPTVARRKASELIVDYGIRAESSDQLATSLSGGNQQKVILARELERNPELIVASEPTRGLDIEATRYVHKRLLAAAEAGAAILLITSDLDEAFSLADTVQVLFRGRLTPRERPGDVAAQIGALMAGVI